MSKPESKSLTIDSQVHTYERDSPERPWVGTLHGPAEVTGEDMVEAMDEVGVDGAILVSAWTMYRYDPSYALDVYANHPGRFGLVKPFNYQSPSVAEEITEWARTPGAIGARILLMDEEPPRADDLGVKLLLSACAQHRLPINVMCWGKLPLLGDFAQQHPNTQFVLDHIGLRQPFEPPAPKEPFADLANVLALAEYANVAIKISGACTLSHQAFPYTDIWPQLHQVFDAFGIDKCMWGTDWTRAVELLTYQQGVDSFRAYEQLSANERAALMGGSLSRIYNWSPTTA